MKSCKINRVLITALAFGLFGGTALAQNGNPCPGDKEYQFNIIGTKTKNQDLTNDSGHRIFVPLDGHTRIYMTGDTDTVVDPESGDYGATNDDLDCGNTFDILDANGTDGKALLLVPCDPLTADNPDPDVCFDVWATPLGKAGSGPVEIDVVCDFDDTCLTCDIDGEEATDTCATGNIDISLASHSGKPVQKDITPYFRASGCIDIGGTVGVCDPGDIDFRNEWIFNIEQLEFYYWDYDANGNRIVQIRFCNTEDVEGACTGVVE